ncbi:hypothetical protein C9374_006743 [Naegleria lovaniensis]|uniref:GYF domain-containing protein n=1 Tax=Naegleria lovaniensis TaxID=51637 RepID=A0AA88GNE5_NAELO|nr:uncharacterized protein C9374_006743 [Naegleria lovaniensis]KAG2379626.1 hypothetical protein C9374_006743 [Naegleria lovaniensis]
MKRKFEHSSAPSNSSNKHVKFSSVTTTSSHDHVENTTQHADESKHTLQSIREAKSLRTIKQLQGFEHTTSILGQVNETGSGLEGEEGNLNQERFIDEENNNTVMEPFHLEAERMEGIFKDKQTKAEEQRKKKKKLQQRSINKVIRKNESDEEDSDDNEETDVWADDLEEMNPSLSKKQVLSNEKEEEHTTLPELTLSECHQYIVDHLVDRKETISKALQRLKKSPSTRNEEEDASKVYNELIKIANILITHYNIYDIYDKKRESFQKRVKWEYRVKDTNEIHGPFSTSDMIAWIEHGMLTNDNVQVRIFCGESDDFLELNSVDFTKYE